MFGSVMSPLICTAFRSLKGTLDVSPVLVPYVDNCHIVACGTSPTIVPIAPAFGLAG